MERGLGRLEEERYSVEEKGRASKEGVRVLSGRRWPRAATSSCPVFSNASFPSLLLLLCLLRAPSCPRGASGSPPEFWERKASASASADVPPLNRGEIRRGQRACRQPMTARSEEGRRRALTRGHAAGSAPPPSDVPRPTGLCVVYGRPHTTQGRPQCVCECLFYGLNKKKKEESL